MSRLSLGIGTVAGDGTGDPARTGGNKINLNFAELYAFLGGDTPTQTAGSVLLGNGTNPVTSFASTAGRLVIGNGSSGLTDDANLTWDATNGLVAKKPISCPVTAGGGARNERFGAGTSIGSGLNDCLVIGNGASAANSSDHVVVGAGASTTGFAGNVIIGKGAGTGRSACILIGARNSASTDSVVAIGSDVAVSAAFSSGNGTVGAIGSSISQAHEGGFSIGVSSMQVDELIFGWSRTNGGADSPSFRLVGSTDQYVPRSAFRVGTAWVDATDATRKARALFYTFDTAEREYMRADATGAAAVNISFLSGGNFVTQGAALATTATDGFLYIPTSAGAPTGAPTAFTGTVATEYDTTNDLLKVYNSSWKTCPTQLTGSWTPADNSGAALTFTGVSANYAKIGNMVFAYFKLTYPVTASGANASISGLPFTIANADYATAPAVADTSASITGGLVLVPVKNTTTAALDVGTPVGPATNLQLSGATIAVMLIYPVA